MVGRAGNVLTGRVVAMVTLVEGQQTEEEGGGPLGRGGTPVLPMDGRLVVAQRNDGLPPQVGVVRKHVEVGQVPRQLQVGVGNITGGVITRDQTALEVGRKRPPPSNTRAGGVGREPHSTHAK